MNRLKLNFLDKSNQKKELNQIEVILDEYGQEIYTYAKGYFNYIITTASENNEVKEASLYIIVPEIGYDYKVLSISYEDKEYVVTKFFTLKTKQVEEDKINIKNGWEEVHRRISELLSTVLANETFRFLVNQVEMKREFREE